MGSKTTLGKYGFIYKVLALSINVSVVSRRRGRKKIWRARN